MIIALSVIILAMIVAMGFLVKEVEDCRKSLDKESAKLYFSRGRLETMTKRYKSVKENKQLIINALRVDIENLEIELEETNITSDLYRTIYKIKRDRYDTLKDGLYYSKEHDILIPMCDLDYIGEFDKGNK